MDAPLKFSACILTSDSQNSNWWQPPSSIFMIRESNLVQISAQDRCTFVPDVRLMRSWELTGVFSRV